MDIIEWRKSGRMHSSTGGSCLQPQSYLASSTRAAACSFAFLSRNSATIIRSRCKKSIGDDARRATSLTHYYRMKLYTRRSANKISRSNLFVENGRSGIRSYTCNAFCRRFVAREVQFFVPVAYTRIKLVATF